MTELESNNSLSEDEFASLITDLAERPAERHQLIELLHEDHPIYDQRGAATIVRMRGWILHTLSKDQIKDDELIFVLEELDTGIDPYLVAAAAKALRSYPNPKRTFAPFVVHALANIRYRDEPVSFSEYGGYGDETTILQELLATLEWLGESARSVLPELQALVSQPAGLSKKLLNRIEKIVRSLEPVNDSTESCCLRLSDRFRWEPSSRKSCTEIESVLFEDQNHELTTFAEFFKGQPSIVVFFYTRCDNPLKCSLTITKLGRIQRILVQNGFASRVNTAAITYDPEFDSPERIRGYGENRGLLPGPRHRLLRARDGIDSVRKHFKLGVNFIESLVNRHRIEVYILDAQGQVASSFQRIHWDEQEVVNAAIELLDESKQVQDPNSKIGHRKSAFGNTFGLLASIGFAFFPKCPICWAAYLSMFGIAGLGQIPYSPWLQPLLATVMLINLGSVWLRARATERMISFYLASAGAIAIISSKFSESLKATALLGIVLTLAGSMLSTFSGRRQQKELTSH